MWGRWAFDRADIANVGSQAQTGEMMPICKLLPVWKDWTTQANETAIRDAESHAYFLALLERQEDFDSAPSLYYHRENPMQVADGRRRLLAAYEFLSNNQSSRTIEVFWERTQP